MAMKAEVYEDILNTIHQFKGLHRDCMKILFAKHNSVDKRALCSILAQEVQQKTISNYYRVFNKYSDYYKNYLHKLKNGEPIGILLRMSVSIDATPSMLARHVLDKHCARIKDNGSKKGYSSQMLKDTTLIDDPNLAYEILLCNLYDYQNGPIHDLVGFCSGRENEDILEKYCREANLAYSTESQLHDKGYDKTPDVKLEVPIAVNGFVINWIESKARFGGTIVHRKNIKSQLLSYWNRFGPGLVIYWYGYVESIKQLGENRFIISDRFPEEITYMNPSSITVKFSEP